MDYSEEIEVGDAFSSGRILDPPGILTLPEVPNAVQPYEAHEPTLQPEGEQIMLERVTLPTEGGHQTPGGVPSGVVQMDPVVLQEGVVYPEFRQELSPTLSLPQPTYSTYSPPPPPLYSYNDSAYSTPYYFENSVVPHPSPLPPTETSLTPLLTVGRREEEEEERLPCRTAEVIKEDILTSAFNMTLLNTDVGRQKFNFNILISWVRYYTSKKSQATV